MTELDDILSDRQLLQMNYKIQLFGDQLHLHHQGTRDDTALKFSCFYAGDSNENLKYVLFFITHVMVCWSMTHFQICCYFIRCYAAIFLHDGFNRCNALWCHYWVCLTGSRRVCYRTNAVHELPSPPVHLLQWQICITVLNFHSSINFDGFHPFTA